MFGSCSRSDSVGAQPVDHRWHWVFASDRRGYLWNIAPAYVSHHDERFALMLVPFIASLVTSAAGVSAGSVPVPLAPAPADTNCIVMNSRIEGRRSPLDSLTFAVQGYPVKVCYGRPAARGRTMIGGTHVPYGEIWRTGANEPTMIHTTVAISIAGVAVEPGTYSLYTVPNASDWKIIVNGSTSQWGHERNYTGEVAEQEIGRVTVPSRRTEDHVETFTIRAESAENGDATLILEWERTRVGIPIEKQ